MPLYLNQSRLWFPLKKCYPNSVHEIDYQRIIIASYFSSTSYKESTMYNKKHKYVIVSIFLNAINYLFTVRCYTCKHNVLYT